MADSDLSDIFASFKNRKPKGKAAEKAAESCDLDSAKKAVASDAGKPDTATKKKKRKADAAPAEPQVGKKAKQGGSDPTPKASMLDSEFFDLRGEQAAEPEAGDPDAAQPRNPATLAALAELQKDAPKTQIVVANLQPSVQAVYTEAVQAAMGLLEKPASVEVDWGTHVVRLRFDKPEDALATSAVLEGKHLFQRRLRTGLARNREGEVLVRNLLSHVTEDVLQHYMSRFGTVISCKVLSHHAVWSKAYVLFADERDAIRCVNELHGMQNTIQDAAIFLSTTSVHAIAKKKQAKKRPAKRSEGDGEKAGNDSESDEPYTYNASMEAGY